MKKAAIFMAMSLMASLSLADMTGEWALAYNYGCDDTQSAAILTFTEEQSNSTESKGIFQTSGGLTGRYLEKMGEQGHMLIFQYISSNTYNTVYAGNKQGLTMYTGFMQTTGNSTGSNAGCFSLSQISNFSSPELEID